METLVLALIAVRNQHRQTEKSLPEPNDFQPLDLQALRNLYKAKDTPPSRPAGQQQSYAAQAAAVSDGARHALALKSGNFGTVDFFEKALAQFEGIAESSR